MNRRSFLSSILPAAILLSDPERLLWTPTKTIFIPPAPKLAFHPDAFKMCPLPTRFRVGDVISFGGSPRIYRITHVATGDSFGFVAIEKPDEQMVHFPLPQ